MELSTEFHVVAVSLALILVLTTWRILDSLWFTPKKIEKSLRAQGLNGSSYKFFSGDLKEMAQMSREARSKPISLKDDIVPRVAPFEYKSVGAYGKICFAWMGAKPVVYVTEQSMVKEIFMNYHIFQKSRRENRLMRKLRKGIVDAEGDQWVKHKKIINPAFHLEKLKNMLPAFYMSCNKLINKWEKLLTKDSSCEVDVQPYIQTMSSDALSRTTFGISFEEGSKIVELQNEMLKLILESGRSAYIPGLSFLPTKRNKRLKEINQNLKASIRGIIDMRLVAMKSGQPNKNDLLEILLRSNDEEIKQEGNGNSGLSIEEIIEECKLFYIAGQETIANLLVWTMVLLGHNINWQEQARDEVLHLFRYKKPDFEGLIHLNVTISDITLPAGTLLSVSLVLLHNDRNIWGDDVKEFNPKRFSEGVSKVTKGQTCYLPFGGGPRICVGQNFAMLEAKLVLAMILRNFSFEISPSYSHAPHVVGTLQPQFGAHLILRKL